MNKEKLPTPILLNCFIQLVASIFFGLGVLFSTIPASGEEDTTKQNSWDDQFFDLVKAACDGEDQCLRKVGSLAYFVWQNKDKADIGFQVSSCSVRFAVKEGYIWKPTKIFDEMSSAKAIEMSRYVCRCAIGYWAAEFCKKL